MPRNRHAALLLACLLNLTGCLQIELAGPVAGARISIAPLRGGEPLVSGLQSATEAGVKREYGENKWAGFKNAARAALLGLVELPQVSLQDEMYYLVTATGGVDKDGDGNGLIDGSDIALSRDLHAIMTGAQLKQTFNRVTVLSEALYRVVEPELDELNDAELAQRLDELAGAMVADVNADGQRGYADILRWSYLSKKQQYLGPAEFLERLPRSITDFRYSDNILLIDSLNAVVLAGWRPARQGSPWTTSLVGCISPVVYGDLCSFETLPLIGLDNASPAVAEIMTRLVVSHPWMAERFEQVLYRMPEDVLLLFRSVVAVVIGADIRPSYYSPGIGTLYLDADFFWLSEEERRPVSTEPDYRAEYANAVNFTHLWRYVQDNQDAFDAFYDGEDVGYRALEDIELNVASLLFHELAHAVDSFSPDRIGTLRGSRTPNDTWRSSTSNKLEERFPLQSDSLLSIAGVLFAGEEPTPAEASLSAANIGNQFAPDGASDLYAYFTQYEDVAMLFEEAMMAIHYGVQRDVAFTNFPELSGSEDGIRCSDLMVGWGMRGRITAPQVIERAKLVVRDLLPERNYNQVLHQLPPPAPLSRNRNWCDSISLNKNRAFVPYRKSEQRPSPRQWTTHRFR